MYRLLLFFFFFTSSGELRSGSPGSEPSWCLKKAEKHFEPTALSCCCQDVELHFWRDTAYLDAERWGPTNSLVTQIRIRYLIIVSSFQIVKHPRQQFAAVGCSGESGHDDLGKTNMYFTTQNNTRHFIIYCDFSACFFSSCPSSIVAWNLFIYINEIIIVSRHKISNCAVNYSVYKSTLRLTRWQLILCSSSFLNVVLMPWAQLAVSL